MATLLQEGQVKTNSTGWSYARQTALGVLPTTGWRQVEPNAFTNFGAPTEKVERSPISPDRQQQKDAVVSVSSGVEYDADLTLSSFNDHSQGFLFVNGINSDVTQVASSAVTTTGFTVAALVEAQADKFEEDTLIWVTGATNSVNNGLHAIDADIATGATEIEVSTTLVAETTDTRVSFAGHRIAAADTVTWTWDAANRRATLASTGIRDTLVALGLTLGKGVRIGSVRALGGAVQNAFQNATANDMHGYARVRSLSDADSIVFDKVAAELQFTDDTDPTTPVDILLGQFLRNVSVNDDDFCEIAYTYEKASPGAGDGTPGNTDTSYEYAIDNFANTLAIQMGLSDKATVSFNFLGRDTLTATTTQQTGAADAIAPTQTSAFNTSSDIARLRITELDEDGLTTDFKNLTLNISNNVSGEYVLGRIGPRFINTGNFNVSIEANILFTNPNVITAIRQNTTLTMDFILANDNGVIVFDIGALTLGGGAYEFPVNESVQVSLTGRSFRDPVLNTSIGITVFPVPLPTS